MKHSQLPIHILILLLLPAALLLGPGLGQAQALEKLSQQEKKVLQRRDARSDAEEVGVGDYSRGGYIWSTTLQLSVLLATVFLIAFAGWKLPGLSSRVLALSRLQNENRNWKRVQVLSEVVEAEITDRSDGSVRGRAVLRDIAPGGACLEFTDCPDEFQPGNELQLRIRVRDGTELILSNLRGSVRWIKQNQAGIQFSNILHYSQDILESLFTPVNREQRNGAAT